MNNRPFIRSHGHDPRGVDGDRRHNPTTIDGRLGHCTPSAFSGHNPLCDRDGTYCSAASTHAGPCTPHGTPR